MELVLFSLVMAWALTRYGVTDAIAATKGTDSPRVKERIARAAQAHERSMARIAQGRGPTISEAIGSRIAERIVRPRGDRPAGPARQWLGEWWGDSWSSATDRRRARHERAAKGDLRRQRAARAVRDWWRRRTQPTPPVPVWAEAEVIRDEHDVVDAEIVDDPTTPTPPASSGTTTPDPAQEPATGGSRTGPVTGMAWIHDGPGPLMVCPLCTGEGCDTCGGDGEVPAWLADPDVVGAGAAAEWGWKPPTDRPTSESPTQDPDSEVIAPAAAAASDLPDPAASAAPDQHDEHEPDGHLASVHPIREEPITMTSTQPTIISGETVDPRAAHAFVTNFKDLADSMSAELELSISNLEACGVSGAPVDHLRQMWESAQILAGNSAAAATHFERHLATQDVVMSDDTISGTVKDRYIGTVS